MYSLLLSIILVLILICFTPEIHSEVTKCCSDQHVLNIQKRSCETLENQTIWDFVNIQSSSLSNCGEPKYVFVENESYIELNGCIDKDKNDQYVAISCLKFPTIGVHLMNKCCPIGKSYDYKERHCTRNSGILGHFKKLLGNTTVVFQNRIPHCSEDEVFIEYFTSVHNIQFVESNLRVERITVPSNKFCIEDLVNSNDAKNSDENVIVRSCRPKSVCGEIPCIRRCCNADQIMLPQPKGKRKCQFHPNGMNLKPVFYDIQLPLNNEQKIVHPKGMIYILNCNKKICLLNQKKSEAKRNSECFFNSKLGK